MNPYLDFETIKEEWGKFSLRDGSVLKLKCVLVSIERTEVNNKPQYQTQLQNIQTVYPDPALVGTRNDKIHTKEELFSNVDKTDLDFEIMNPSTNKYILDNGVKLNIFLNVIKIRRTTLKNKKGEPIYLVDTNFTVNFDGASTN